MTQFLPGIISIAPEPDAVCEDCGEMAELRPYGPRNLEGRRSRVCFKCAMENLPEATRAFSENFNASLDGRMPPNV
jgi:hypothetical protein